MNKNRIAVFDFCGTIVDFQSADAFIKFIIQKHPSRRARFLELWRKFLIATYLMLILKKFKITNNKKIIASMIKGIKKTEIDNLAIDFVNQIIEPRLIKNTIEKLKWVQSKGYICIIVSAGYESYLKIFAERMGFHGVVATQLLFKNGVATGKLSKDVIGKEKITALYNFLNSTNYSDAEIVFAISDSKSDLPILSIAKTPVVISYKVHQNWVESGMEEIIYEK